MDTKLTYRDKLAIHRLDNGVLQIQANNDADLYFGQGYAQARDRGMQMILTRILGQGRGTELLRDDDQLLGIDCFFRRMNWQDHVAEQLEQLSPATRDNLQAWCAGINHSFSQKQPWEIRLLGIQIEPWAPEHCLLFLRMMSYIGMQQLQGDIERFIVQMVQADIPDTALEELFPGQLTGIDRQLLQQVRLSEKLVPDSVTWLPMLSAFTASNNWVINGKRSANGQAMLANDPHLEGNRLPNVWQEYYLQCGERYLLGAGMPGVPGVLIGRNNDVAWGVTYSFMDTIDSWVERCQDGKYWQDGQWHDFRQRREIIKRKKHPPQTLFFYENHHGILDGDPAQPGHYLATRWSCAQAGSAALEMVFDLLHLTSAASLCQTVAKIEFSFNWVSADNQGNIGYQMSGLLPKRREGASGLFPLDGTDSNNDWRGFHDGIDLPRVCNPDCGYILTANNDLNHYGKYPASNIPSGYYRSKRIESLLESKDKITLEDFMNWQHDVYSLQARSYLEVLLPLLDDSPAARILKKWDLCYSLDSQGAWLFERFYRQLIRDVFSRNANDGQATVMDFLLDETHLVGIFYSNFDKVLLSPSSLWFAGRSREEIFAQVWQQQIAPLLPQQIRYWGEVNRMKLVHILFNGKLPQFLGFDYGPIAVAGGPATISQGFIFRHAGRMTSAVPSLRMVVDMGQPGIKTQLLGGPSDRRFSRWYRSGITAWQTREYKDLPGDVFNS